MPKLNNAGKAIVDMEFSFSKYINQLGGISPYSFMCECRECENKTSVQVWKDEASLIANKLGFNDQMTKRDFERLHHTIVNRFGKDKR